MHMTIVRLLTASVVGILLAAGMSAGPMIGPAMAHPHAGRQAPPRDPAWRDIGHANNITAIAADANYLYATDRNNRLWIRPRVHAEVNWTDVGHANNVVGLAADRGGLYAADGSNQLWIRSVEGDWIKIGHANNVVGMASDGAGLLWAATSDNRLWDRAEEGGDWVDFGIRAYNVVGLAASTDSIFVADRNNRLWTLSMLSPQQGWQTYGHANNVVAMTGFGPYLYVVDRNNRLWFLDTR